MHKNIAYIKTLLLTITLLVVGQISFSQDTSKSNFEIDTNGIFQTVSISMSPVISDYAIIHSPTKDDTIFCNKYSKLINSGLTKKNYSNYYSLACSLWELNRLTEAEKLFLKIIDSKEPYFAGTYYHSSDIPGDSKTATYGYGSFTSNYKNYACRYLAKIYVEEKKFDQALKYVEYADKKYIVEYNCGTGYMWYQGEIEGLYGFCYEGLGEYENIIKMFLPQYCGLGSGILIRVLKKVYSQTEINNYLKVAENSIVCVVDTFQSSSFITHNYGEKNEITTEIKYVSGTATTKLFDRQITLYTPYLENGETVTRELFLKNFKESGFYTALTDSE